MAREVITDGLGEWRGQMLAGSFPQCTGQKQLQRMICLRISTVLLMRNCGFLSVANLSWLSSDLGVPSQLCPVKEFCVMGLIMPYCRGY